jgi:flagellar hook-associated protein 3 FlgL
MVTAVSPDSSIPDSEISGPDNTSYENNGTWLYIRPTAVYQGDDHDTQVLTLYGTTAQGTANGSFARDVAVRIDSRLPPPPAALAPNDVVSYSYSVDDGANWISASATVNSAGELDLLLPGGYLAFANPATASLADGNQFVVHPHRADITLQIGDADYIAVNMVGKDIFGGYYNYPGDSFPGVTPVNFIDYPVRVDEGRANLFETLGDLIAALETNSQAGCQEALPKIEEAMKLLLTRTAEVGGRENRLITTQAAIIMRQYSEEDTLSAVEDVDIYELTARLAQQQTAYNSVLKSSSMIMQMSLVNFL